MTERLDDQGHDDKPRSLPFKSDELEAAIRQEYGGTPTTDSLIEVVMSAYRMMERDRDMWLADDVKQNGALGRALAPRSAGVALSDPIDRQLADKIDEEAAKLRAMKEDRGDAEYWLLRLFLDNQSTIVSALRRPFTPHSSVGASKPVAWMCEDNFGRIMFSWGEKKGADPNNRGPWQWRPLYTEPVTQSASGEWMRVPKDAPLYSHTMEHTQTIGQRTKSVFMLTDDGVMWKLDLPPRENATDATTDSRGVKSE